MKAEGYSLHVYCSNGPTESDEFRGPHTCVVPFEGGRGEFFGSTKALAYNEARRAGWKLGDVQDFCSGCVRANLTK